MQHTQELEEHTRADGQREEKQQELQQAHSNQVSQLQELNRTLQQFQPQELSEPLAMLQRTLGGRLECGPSEKSLEEPHNDSFALPKVDEALWSVGWNDYSIDKGSEQGFTFDFSDSPLPSVRNYVAAAAGHNKGPQSDPVQSSDLCAQNVPAIDSLAAPPIGSGRQWRPRH